MPTTSHAYRRVWRRDGRERPADAAGRKSHRIFLRRPFRRLPLCLLDVNRHAHPGVDAALKQVFALGQPDELLLATLQNARAAKRGRTLQGRKSDQQQHQTIFAHFSLSR